jgi:hypothetical protein
MVYAITFVFVETVVTVNPQINVVSFAFEGYCHVQCVTAKLVEMYGCFLGKSLNFLEATPLSLLRRLYAVYSLPSLPQMPFYLYISPGDII